MAMGMDLGEAEAPVETLIEAEAAPAAEAPAEEAKAEDAPAAEAEAPVADASSESDKTEA